MNVSYKKLSLILLFSTSALAEQNPLFVDPTDIDGSMPQTTDLLEYMAQQTETKPALFPTGFPQQKPAAQPQQTESSRISEARKALNQIDADLETLLACSLELSNAEDVIKAHQNAIDKLDHEREPSTGEKIAGGVGAVVAIVGSAKENLPAAAVGFMVAVGGLVKFYIRNNSCIAQQQGLKAEPTFLEARQAIIEKADNVGRLKQNIEARLDELRRANLPANLQERIISADHKLHLFSACSHS